MNHVPDEDLIRSIDGGDMQAFEQLVLRYQGQVARFIWRLVSDEADREEVCQEVFLKVYLNLHRFRHDAKFSTWLYSIAWRQAVSFLRKRDYPIEEAAGVQAVGRALDDDVGEDEVGRMVSRELASLNLEERSIVTLFHLQECSIEEIARIVDRPPGTIKSTLFRVRKKMKDQLIPLLADKFESSEVPNDGRNRST